MSRIRETHWEKGGGRGGGRQTEMYEKNQKHVQPLSQESIAFE